LTDNRAKNIRYGVDEYGFSMADGLHIFETDLVRIKPWSASIKEDPPTSDYKAIMESDIGLKDWLTKIVCVFEHSSDLI
jgi:hypothetical protein